jgi:hypothetical protein
VSFKNIGTVCQVNFVTLSVSQLFELLQKQLKEIFRDIPAWLSLILAGRPWPASEASAANHHHGDSFGGQYRYESSPNIP